ncbi:MULTISPECIES: hypothetical protein [unclassified Amycolatopsis]|uniref:hypothetical protein n=1 Tax=unclassified Amycolatopsis TaxID=2618356 RepID=UPI0034562054
MSQIELCADRPAWLKMVWRGWARPGATSSVEDEAVAVRAYRHWRHAEELLDVATSEFHRIDIVTTLKRAIDHRVRSLREMYQLNRLRQVVGERKIGDLETLQRLNVSRQFMLGKLMLIRNAVEHQDAVPPAVAECRELVELVWYFLKSTDALLCVPLTEVNLDSSTTVEDGSSSHSEGGVTLSFDFETWLPKIAGNMPERHFSPVAKPGWAEVRLDALDVHDKWVSFAGTVHGPREVLWSMWRDYFAWAAGGPRAVLYEEH